MIILTRIAVLAVFLALVMVSGVEAEEYDYVEYTIQKGDTLWDISGLELNDNFQWPMVWKVNPHINNPDRIYPGQVINIPVSFLLPMEKKLERESPLMPMEKTPPGSAPVMVDTTPREITPIKGSFMISRERMLESGYITKKVPYKGEITGSALNKKIFGKYDELYVKSTSEALIGDKFYVIRNEGMVEHPSGKNLGYLVRIAGVLELEEAGTKDLKAKVIESFEDIRHGDVIDNYYEIDIPFSTDVQRYPHVESVVVATRLIEKEHSGSFDLIFIDKGKNDGLRDSDILMTLLPGTDDRRNGLIRLIKVRDATSLALIIDSKRNIAIGDIVTGVE
jgi:LysM repeat protein